MRTYKEPKRIDKPRIRDSAIRQLNDAAKFAAIHSAAISLREDEENARKCIEEDRPSGSCDNHVIQDFSAERNVVINCQTESYKTEVSLTTGTVTITEVANKPFSLLSSEPKNQADDKDSSFSSSLSSIPTDSYISSDGKLSDLDNSGISTHDPPLSPQQTAENGVDEEEKKSDPEEPVPEKKDSALTTTEKKKVSKPVKKKAVIDNIKKKSPKETVKKVPVKKKVKQNSPEVKTIKNKTAKGRKKANATVANDCNAIDLSLGDNSKTDESGSSVSPRASKRTPKKNRKYHSDEDELFQNLEDGSPSRKRSARAVKKRKINFNEDDDDEFEDEHFDFELDISAEKVEMPKSKPPPKKLRKVELNSEFDDEEEDNNTMVTSDLIPKPKKIKGSKKVKTKTNGDDVDPDHIEKVDDEKESPPKKKKVTKKRKVDNVTEKDTEEKCSVTSEVKPPKKKRPPKKKVEKNLESKENLEDIKEEEDGAEIEEKKDPVLIACPLCGHLSRSKSANTRHIRRCVDIPRTDNVLGKPTGDKVDKDEEKKESVDEKENPQEKDGINVKEETENSSLEVKPKMEEEEDEGDEEKDHLDSSFDVSGDEDEGEDKHMMDLKLSGPKKSINIETLMKKQSPDTTFKCEHCEYATPKRAMLGRHLRTHGIYVCLRCNLVYDSKEVLKEHVLKEHKDRADYKLCRKCSRYIRCHEISLEKHMEECTGPVPFKCKFCEKEFKYESSLKSHIIRHDPDAPKRFNCPQCTYKSNYKANLKKHLKNIHNTERVKKEFPCTFENCEKKFHTEDNLKRHLKFHSDVRNFPCPQCPKRFKTSAALRGHVIVHDPARPFKCNINDCTKDFRSKKLLKNHMEEYHNLTDKKFPCDFEGCKFTFFKRSHLQRHKISHTGERKFGCSVCGKGFRHADNLKVHMRQHTNEKPVACHLCSFTCRQKSSLQYHLHKFHGIAPKPKKAKKTTDANVTASSTDSKPILLSSEFKENHTDLLERTENSFDTKPLTPKLKPENPMDLYEFRSDEEFDDDSVLLPLRQDKTSTPIRHEKISYLSHTSKSDLLDVTSKSLDFDDEDKLSDIDTQKDSKKLKDENEMEPKTTKDEEEEEDEPEISTAKTQKPKKSPGRKKKVKATETKSSISKPDEENSKPEKQEEVKNEKSVKPKAKRGRKPKPKPEPATDTVDEKNDPEKVPVKPPRKKPGPKPKNKLKSPEEAVKIPKKRGPKKKKPTVDEDLPEEEPRSPQKKKRKYVRKKKTEKQTEEKKTKGGKKTEGAESQETEAEDTIIYSELEHNTANEDDGEATEIEGFNEEEGGSKSPGSSKSFRRDSLQEDVEKEKEIEEEKAMSEEEKAISEEEKAMSEEEKEKEKVEEPVETKPVKEDEEKRTSEVESDRMSSGVDTDFEDDLKPPPAPRPPPVVESDEGDIESGPEDTDTPGRDFESTPPKSVQNHSVQSLPGRDYESTPRDYESTPPKSVQPDSVPNYGSNENKNDVMSPPSKGYSSVEATKRDLSIDSQNEDREMSNPVPSNISYPQAGSVELPSSVASNPPQASQPNTGYGSQSESAMPEVDKDYLGQYLQQFDSGGRSSDDNSRLNPSVERPTEHINIPTSPQDKELPPLNLSSSVPPLNLTTTPDRDSMHSKGADLSNKRMEILACDRQQEEHFQQRSENPSRSSERIPDNVYDSLSSMNSYLSGSRENPSLFPPTTSSSYAFSESDSILQRQRMTTPFLTQSDPNALQNLHRMADSALTANNPASLLRRPTTVPSREEIFAPPSAVSQTMARNPFHTSWTQDVRHPHWTQASYLQRQTGSTTNPLFPKDNYLPGRDFMFDTSRRTVAERNIFPGLSQTQRPDLPHETFPGFEFGYFGSHGYPGAPPLDYTRSSSQTAQKTFDERYRQTATGMGDFRTLPPSSSSDMFRSMNPSFNFDKYMYSRDPVYHPQHVGDTTNSPFLTHGVPSQHAMFERDYTRGFYHQNSPYSFMNDKPYAAAAAAASAKLTHSSTPGMGQERDFVPRPNTAAAAASDSQIPMQDPYRHPMLYNMMNRYFES